MFSNVTASIRMTEGRFEKPKSRTLIKGSKILPGFNHWPPSELFSQKHTNYLSWKEPGAAWLLLTGFKFYNSYFVFCEPTLTKHIKMVNVQNKAINRKRRLNKETTTTTTKWTFIFYLQPKSVHMAAAKSVRPTVQFSWVPHGCSNARAITPIKY